MLRSAAAYAACLTLTRADNFGHVAARQFAPIHNGVQYFPCLRQQGIGAPFFFGPEPYAITQPIRLDQVFHERDLIQAGLQEEPGELDERFLAAAAATIEVVPARQVAGLQLCFIGILLPG